ncbi:unnamed protein product [Rotaria socialis]|uniref:glutathione transferase n=1 Tax=Rotaria socialis TaxID=392032 RepID=A0A818H9J7_9BILA|nr:unnamed protein product [Rotaria socialis]CAF3294957.1 unnamed protein product [Rotaria socialis]CAF3395427.1 unnamed protein product [Rotaria socialis]CAF3425823.1 unnamed protein product [Rotaria socialis]CAF3500843.1 unnamed protein product [Rotaria socialis]
MGCSSSAPSQDSIHRTNNTQSPSDAKDSIIVYGMAKSVATQRVLATLIEKGLKFQLKIVNLMTGENKNRSYLEKQPFGGVPALEDTDGFIIYESRAICRYLEAKYKDKGTELIPTNSIKAEGIFEQAASTEISNFDPSASDIIGERVYKKFRGGEPDMNKVAELRRDLAENLDVYEKILSKQPYLGGNTFTLADLFHLPVGSMLTNCGEGELFESRPNVKKWWNTISTRPAWKTVLATM